MHSRPACAQTVPATKALRKGPPCVKGETPGNWGNWGRRAGRPLPPKRLPRPGRSWVGSAEPDTRLLLWGGTGPGRGSRPLPVPGVQGARSARFLWVLSERFVVANGHPEQSPRVLTCFSIGGAFLEVEVPGQFPWSRSKRS